MTFLLIELSFFFIFSGIYWLTHSLWHCFLSAGYVLLYEELLEAEQEAALVANRERAAQKRAERLASLRFRPKLPIFPVSHRAKAA